MIHTIPAWIFMFIIFVVFCRNEIYRIKGNKYSKFAKVYCVFEKVIWFYLLIVQNFSLYFIFVILDATILTVFAEKFYSPLERERKNVKLTTDVMSNPKYRYIVWLIPSGVAIIFMSIYGIGYLLNSL